MRYFQLLAILFMLSSTSALGRSVEDSGAFMGLSVGHSSYDNDDIVRGNTPLSIDLDRTSLYWQFHGGYRFNRYFALEGRYGSLSDVNIDVKLYGMPLDEINVEITALTLHATAIYPLGHSGFDLYGQLGGGRAYSLYEASRGSLRESDNELLWSAGLGFRYTPPRTQSITLIGGYEIYRFELADSFDQKINIFKVGLQHNF